MVTFAFHITPTNGLTLKMPFHCAYLKPFFVLFNKKKIAFYVKEKMRKQKRRKK